MYSTKLSNLSTVRWELQCQLDRWIRCSLHQILVRLRCIWNSLLFIIHEINQSIHEYKFLSDVFSFWWNSLLFIICESMFMIIIFFLQCLFFLMSPSPSQNCPPASHEPPSTYLIFSLKVLLLCKGKYLAPDGTEASSSNISRHKIFPSVDGISSVQLLQGSFFRRESCTELYLSTFQGSCMWLWGKRWGGGGGGGQICEFQSRLMFQNPISIITWWECPITTWHLILFLSRCKINAEASIALLQGMYFVSSVLLMRMNMPPEYR